MNSDNIIFQATTGNHTNCHPVGSVCLGPRTLAGLNSVLERDIGWAASACLATIARPPEDHHNPQTHEVMCSYLKRGNMFCDIHVFVLLLFTPMPCIVMLSHRIKKVILYSHSFHGTKFLSARNLRKGSLF